VSTGVYGYPVDKAAEVAVKTVRKWLDNPENAEKVRKKTQDFF
jgi:O-acetyl-ADP-ribose deacetylase (regulator of RNase III)